MAGASIRRMIEPGEEAPDFPLPDQDGAEVKLGDFGGQMLVLYFYQKAATPGCTTQACGVRDHLSDYSDAGAVVLGVSPDPVKKVKDFHEREGLNFSLLADQDHAVADAYGVWVEKSMYGKTYFGNERTTFVIGPDGAVASVLRKVKPAEHDERGLAAVREAAPPVVCGAGGEQGPATARHVSSRPPRGSSSRPQRCRARRTRAPAYP